MAALVLLCCVSASAADFLGFKLGKTYTYDEICSMMDGKPDSIEGSGWPKYSYLIFKGVRLCFRENGVFYQGTVTGRKYKVFTDLCRGGLKVGDGVEKIYDIPDSFPKKLGQDGYRIFTRSDGDCAEIKYDLTHRRITSITYRIFLD